MYTSPKNANGASYQYLLPAPGYLRSRRRAVASNTYSINQDKGAVMASYTYLDQAPCWRELYLLYLLHLLRLYLGRTRRAGVTYCSYT